DIAGQEKANPAATILSVAMLLKYSFGLDEEAAEIERAVNAVFEKGCFTGDLAAKGSRVLTTSEWTNEVLTEINAPVSN
ncbi:MAG: isocitrate/isopropylmalate family dehydrogenase, partial [Caryophanon sp.]|nr:isocitrate/isopropylmalate family dehydrogenase [Caryophanon sp.]